MFMELNPLASTDIIFELDVTGDGMPDMVTSYIAISEPYKLYMPIVLKE